MVDLYGLAEELNIDDIAVCHAEKFEGVEQLLKKDAELGILPPFTETDIRKRVCPEETLDGAKSTRKIVRADVCSGSSRPGREPSGLRG